MGLSPAGKIGVLWSICANCSLLFCAQRRMENTAQMTSDTLLSIPVTWDISGKDHCVGADLPCHISKPSLVLVLSWSSNGLWVVLVTPFICQCLAVAELQLGAWPGEAADSPSEQRLRINKCLVTDAFFILLALISSFSFPSFLSHWLESCLSPVRAKECWNRG